MDIIIIGWICYVTQGNVYWLSDSAAGMYAGPVGAVPLVSQFEHIPDGTERQTEGRTPD